jgi:Flp pilus assembly protein TadG
MAKKSVFQRAARRFARDRRGNFGMMMALFVPVLVLGAGFGVNIAQVSNARSNLLAALDSAITSTARDLTVGVIKEEDARDSLEAFLFANGTRTFSKLDKLTLDSVVIDRHRKMVEAQASVVVNVAFPLFGAANVQKITTESAARYSDKKIEVAMMLDVTGSMRKTSKTDKIGDLQTAATIAVESLLAGNKYTPDRIRVALVPYAASVNAGALARETVFIEEKNGTNLPPANWTAPAVGAARKDNCATERKLTSGGPDLTDDAPDSLRTAYDSKGKAYTYKALVNRDDRLDNETTTKCPAATIVPLTTDETKLKDEIASFVADGNTGGGIATQWAYYMLSPNWRSAIVKAGLGAGPADPDPEKIAKVAILMTDGEYNRYYAGSNSSTNARNLCTRMKNDGIEVFTIGFALTNSTAKSTLKNCATPDTGVTQHFYDAATGDELRQAFNEIVRNIERLALTR